jgi:hypothetical protein
MKNKLLGLFIAGALSLNAWNANAEVIVGLTTNNQIFVIPNSSSPATITGPFSVTGVASNQNLVAIDYRPSNGMLYALGYNNGNNDAQIYTLTASGNSYTATAINSTPVTLQLANAQSVGFDFVSTMSNQIFVTETNGSNYVLNADNGGIISSGTTLAFAPADINASTTAAVGASAFTNSFYGADYTSIIGYDITTNSIVTFDASNNSVLHTLGGTGLILNLPANVGMDSYYDMANHTNVTYVVAKPIGVSGTSLYTINNTTGMATSVGVIGSGNLNVRDIAVEITHNVSPTLQGQLIVGLTKNQRNLIFFDSENPSVIRNIVNISGIASGETLVAIDFRPRNMLLYGLAYNNSTMQYRIYSINTTTGVATAVNTIPSSINLGSSTNTMAGFDFNPVTDRIRITGNNGYSVQVDPATGTIVSTDNALQYATGDINAGSTIALGSIAYTNSYAGATTTNLIGLDYNNGGFVNFSTSGGSTVNSVLNLSSILGTGGNTDGYMDVYYDSATNGNWGYLAANENNSNYGEFYTMNTQTGTTVYKGSVGPGVPVSDIAVQPAGKGGVATAVNTVNKTGGLYLYPNPAANMAHVLMPAITKGSLQVSVLNLQGQVLRSFEFAAGTQQVDINLQDLPNGIYNLRVHEQGDATQNIRFVKAN